MNGIDVCLNVECKVINGDYKQRQSNELENQCKPDKCDANLLISVERGKKWSGMICFAVHWNGDETAKWSSTSIINQQNRKKTSLTSIRILEIIKNDNEISWSKDNDCNSVLSILIN